MQDKGYPHPLYSLDLVNQPADDDEARFVLRSPRGFLRLAAHLRRRGAAVTSLDLLVATDDRLDLYARFQPLLASVGMTQDWAGSLRYWLEQLEISYRTQSLLAMNHMALLQRFKAHDQACEQAFRGLWLKLRLTGIHLCGVPRALPRSHAERSAVLDLAAAQLESPQLAESVARLPVTAGSSLRELMTERRSLWLQRQGADAERQAGQDRAVVLRGALLGDLQRLADAARLVLPRRLAALFELESAWPRKNRPWPKRPQPAVL